MKISCKKGTSSIEIEPTAMNWAGKEYLKYQNQKSELLAKEKQISMNKGTKSVSLSRYPVSRRNILDSGYSLVTNRGTRILRF